MNRTGFVYIMTNKNRTTLYIGVTNDLCRRIYEHKNHLVKNSFTDKYNLEYCIYYEEFSYFNLAIQREKELKKWNRQKKEALINKENPEWKVLVTENGFIRNTAPFSQQVNDLINELKQAGMIPPVSTQKNNSQSRQSEETMEIPPFSRNDKLPGCERGGSDGGFAAITSSLAQNDAAVISSEARNLSVGESPVIPGETQCSEETPRPSGKPVIPGETQFSEETPIKPSTNHSS